MFLHQKNDIIFLLYPILFYNVLFCSLLFYILFLFQCQHVAHTLSFLQYILLDYFKRYDITSYIYIHMYIHSIYIIFLNETIRLFHYVLHYAIFS